MAPNDVAPNDEAPIEVEDVMRSKITALASAAVLAFAFWLHRRLGGLTGDVYGAAIELGEVVMLVLCMVG